MMHAVQRTLNILAAITALSVGASSAVPAQTRITTLTVEGHSSANQSIAARDQFVVIAWAATTPNTTDIYAAASRDGGLTFPLPARVNSTPGDARASGEQPPRIVLIPRSGKIPEIAVVWITKAGSNTRLLSARSTDGGVTFSTSAIVPGSDGAGNRGWHSIAVDSKGRVLVMWLDHRETMAAGSSANMDPTARASLSKLYFSSLDGTKAVEITNSVCYCCKTSLATSGHNVYAVWRHVYPNTERDIAFSMSRDDGRTFSPPLRVSDDHWHIDGCPENGPAVAVDRARHIHVVWPTPLTNSSAIPLSLFYATSSDGKTFTKRVQIPTHGPAYHVQIAIGPDGSPMIAWDEVVGGAHVISMARVNTNVSGQITFTALPSPGRDPGREPGRWFPVLASTNTSIVAAWTRQSDHGGSIEVASLK